MDFTVWVLNDDGTVTAALTAVPAEGAATFATALRASGIGHTAVTVQPSSLSLADFPPVEFRTLAASTPAPV